MSLANERRTSLELAGEPSVLHNPANLPYEAVRAAWWKGFHAAVVVFMCVAVVSLVTLIAVMIITKAQVEVNVPRRPGNAYDPTENEKSSSDPGSAPGTAPRAEPGEPRMPDDSPTGPLIEAPETLPYIDPRFPEFLPADPDDDPLRPDPLPPLDEGGNEMPNSPLSLLPRFQAGRDGRASC